MGRVGYGGSEGKGWRWEGWLWGVRGVVEVGGLVVEGVRGRVGWEGLVVGSEGKGRVGCGE